MQVACEKTVSAMQHVLQRTIKSAKGNSFKPYSLVLSGFASEETFKELSGFLTEGSSVQKQPENLQNESLVVLSVHVPYCVLQAYF